MTAPPTNNQPFVFSSGTNVSVPGTDAPSPNRSDALVRDARREISEIVGEVATAARSDRTKREFFVFLADRMLRAMAAEGVVIWKLHPQNLPCAAARIGTVTDQSIIDASTGCHNLMLQEVARSGHPVVVPATPGATDVTAPANPTEFPAAVVPIGSDSADGSEEYLIEVFLESHGGVSTQRGYLRFAAQLGDLAGEYLRAEQLRYFKSSQVTSRRVDQAIHLIHQHSDPSKVKAQIVDTAAETFGFDRVGLCLFDNAHVKLAAVSHVNRIDQRSEGAQQIRDAAMMELSNHLGLIENADQTEPLAAGIVASSDDDKVRLVAIGQEADSRLDHQEVKRFVQHASIALRNATRFDSIPGGKVIAALAPAIHSSPLRGWTRRILTVASLTILVVVMMFPIPMYVHCKATIAPANVQQITAPRDAVVQTIHVQHRQQVLLGEPLVTLTDPDLEQLITERLGRRAILSEQRNRWNRMLIDTSTESDQTIRLESEQALVREELKAIDAELVVLNGARDDLVLRADRSGQVDAWRLNEKLASRPLSRGDLLLRVIGDDPEWTAEIKVPQNRLLHVRSAERNNELDINVALEATPNEKMNAKIVDYGPAIAAQSGDLSTNVVWVRISDPVPDGLRPAGQDANEDKLMKMAAPATAVMYCGQQPVLYVLFQDAIRSARANIGLYLGDSDQPTNLGASE